MLGFFPFLYRFSKLRYHNFPMRVAFEHAWVFWRISKFEKAMWVAVLGFMAVAILSYAAS